jgi:hypothetical protein
MSPKRGKIYLTNRTASETDDTCGMKYWWSQLEGGKGIVPLHEAEALMVGRDVHEDLSAIAVAPDISVAALDEVTTDMIVHAPIGDKKDIHKMELLYRRLGWMVAFALYIEPKIRDKWDNVAVEDELILDRDPLWVAVTPDRVLRHKQGKYLVYREYKSTISASSKWLESWKYQIQLHIGIKATEEEFVRSGKGEKIAYGQIMGLMKGSEREGRLVHPYVWAYHNSQTGAWTHDYTKARGGNWDHRPIWEYPNGIVEWVSRLGEEHAVMQFPHTAPIHMNEMMLNAWTNRRLAREVEVAQVKEQCKTDHEARMIFFEPRTKNCRPAFGDPCPYIGPCWNASIQADPMRTGDFITRQPHHEVELLFDGE